ncbi:hypothetical protein B0H13DRAFT_2385307 [Mycena leptocephala]|nr:hypothetical protein B0H13DRAFT_2385307 [Mycena leptocephala]
MQREAWAKANSAQDWTRVIWSDECYVHLNDKNGRIYLTGRPEEVWEEECLVPTFKQSNIRGGAAPAPPTRVPVDLALQVIFGPIKWNKDPSNGNRINARQDISSLIATVIPAGNDLEFTTRPYTPHRAYTIVTFASAAIADWVIDAWGQAARGPYDEIYAVHPNT